MRNILAQLIGEVNEGLVKPGVREERGDDVGHWRISTKGCGLEGARYFFRWLPWMSFCSNFPWGVLNLYVPEGPIWCTKNGPPSLGSNLFEGAKVRCTLVINT